VNGTASPSRWPRLQLAGFPAAGCGSEETSRGSGGATRARGMFRHRLAAAGSAPCGSSRRWGRQRAQPFSWGRRLAPAPGRAARHHRHPHPRCHDRGRAGFRFPGFHSTHAPQ
jgi:hypothetical protein